MALWKAKTAIAHADQGLIPEGATFACEKYEPGEHWEPLDDAARAKVKALEAARAKTAVPKASAGPNPELVAALVEIASTRAQLDAARADLEALRVEHAKFDGIDPDKAKAALAAQAVATKGAKA